MNLLAGQILIILIGLNNLLINIYNVFFIRLFGPTDLLRGTFSS